MAEADQAKGENHELIPWIKGTRLKVNTLMSLEFIRPPHNEDKFSFDPD